MTAKVTNLKHPHIKGLFKDVPNDAVADWVAAGWINPSARKPKAEPKAESNSPATDENTQNKDDK